MQIVELGVGIIAGRTDMAAMDRQAERLERKALAEELGHPINWEKEDIEQLRVMVAARHEHPRRQCNWPPQPKAGPQDQPATQVQHPFPPHSATNLQVNQHLLPQTQDQDHSTQDVSVQDQDQEQEEEDNQDQEQEEENSDSGAQPMQTDQQHSATVTGQPSPGKSPDWAPSDSEDERGDY